MEKDERLKLVNGNDGTILMTKSEYLDMAKQKGWNVEIPKLNTGIYDCDVFGGDDVTFDFDVYISGNLFLRDSPILENVFAGEDVILDGLAYTRKVFSAYGTITFGCFACG